MPPVPSKTLSENLKWSAGVIVDFLHKLNFEELNRMEIKKSDKTFGELCLHKVTLFKTDKIHEYFKWTTWEKLEIGEGL